MKARQRIPIERMLLYTIATIGLVTLLPILPGLGIVLKEFGMHRRLSPEYVTTVVHRLKRKGYLRIEGRGKKARIRITESGKKYLESKRITMLHRPKTRRWDGRWRIVMFDIPEKNRKFRDNLRNELKLVGFKKLQESVWVTPDKCEEYIKLLKADRRIGKSLVYLETDTLEYSSSLARNFTISKR